MTEHVTGKVLRTRRQIAIWLFCLCGFIALVVLVGGLTRLTDSGLSITEWKPVTGVAPPLSAQAWQDEFAKYQATPEYRLINKDMSLDAFKTIYWWEWGHRLLARLSGLVFFVPFVYFWASKKLSRAELPKFILLFALGGAQGALGWYMVTSGLSVRVDVSQYRLAGHLGLAFLVYAYSFWIGLEYSVLPVRRATAAFWLRVGTIVLCAAIFLQILLGGLVAGLDAGLIYNSWPLMEGRWIPSGLAQLDPVYLNIFENIVTVQFNHRWLAAAILLLSTLLYAGSRRGEPCYRAVSVVLGVILGQFMLGVWTLLAVAPLSLGVAHQMGALVSFSAALWLMHTAWRGVQPLHAGH